jgi:toxin HigB-1
MIKSFRHKGLRRLFEHGDSSKVRADQVRRIGILLSALDSADALEELHRPSFGLHPLKGQLAGVWAVSVNGNWRITFRFDDGFVSDVDLIDYH